MRTLNRVTLIGNLAADVKHKVAKSGISRAVFPLATNRNIKSENGDLKKCTDYHNIVAFGPLADISDRFLAKGSLVYLEGKLVNNSYEDKEGEKRYRSEILSDKVNILTWKNGNSGKSELDMQDISEELK